MWRASCGNYLSVRSRNSVNRLRMGEWQSAYVPQPPRVEAKRSPCSVLNMQDGPADLTVQERWLFSSFLLRLLGRHWLTKWRRSQVLLPHTPPARCGACGRCPRSSLGRWNYVRSDGGRRSQAWHEQAVYPFGPAIRGDGRRGWGPRCVWTRPYMTFM